MATWEKRVQKLEAEGLTRSDAQAVVDAEDMKMEQHTPGPWEVTCTPQWYSVSEAQGKRRLIARLTNQDEQSALNAENNASLIAAAPALLEALKYVVKWHREHDSGEGELFGLDCVTTCIVAIRQAEGRS